MYQRTPKGAWNHADRQQRYRERLAEKVTHHGYPDAAPLPIDDGKQALTSAAETATEVAAELEDQGPPEFGSEGSEPINQEPIPASMPVSEAVPEALLASLALGREIYSEVRCDFCGRRCGVYTRLGFIRRR